ncbi:MAG: LssY C-terminal domain-containing protein [bacterium]|nr:LssY C-terminal domain-containing protein [bacterium]
MDFLTQFLPALENLHAFGYWIAFFAALLETVIVIGLVIPGGTIILLMGALAATGSFDLDDLIWFAALGAILGDNINYYLGKKYGAGFFSRGFWFIKKEHFEKGKDFFNKHGGKSVFLGRFFPTLKESAPFIAGTLGMKRWPFFIWNVAGAFIWSLAWILPGYFFAHSLNLARLWATRAGFFLAALLIFLIVLYFLKIFIIKKGKQFFIFLASISASMARAIMSSNSAQEMVKRHPLFFKFIHERLSKQKFSGRPFTLLVVAFVYILFLFGGVVESVVSSDVITFFDVRAASFLAVFRSEELVEFFLWVTVLGSWQVALIFCLAFVAILWLWRQRSYIAPFVSVVIGSEVFVWLGKLIFYRIRPETAVYTETSFSFPSGHAAVAVALYGFITYFCLRFFKKWQLQVNIFFAGIMLILFIGFSRLYLGVHYVSDVWGGYLAGALWLIIGISIAEWLNSTKKEPSMRLEKIKALVISAGVIIMAILLYISFALNYHPQLTISLVLPEKIIVSQVDEIFSDNQLKYTETLVGGQQEPLSFIIIADSGQSLVDALNQAGWLLADNITFHSIAREAKAVILKEPYSTAPMRPDFWNSAVHTFGFEKTTDSTTARERHQARFWQTSYVTANNKIVYVGTASFDTGIKWGLTRRVNPNIDAEREFLFNSLQSSGVRFDFQKKPFVEPMPAQNFTGDLFFTDGEAYIISL